MKIRTKLFVKLCLLLLIVSCASTSTATDDATLKAKGFIKVEDKGVVYLYRANRAFGAALSTNIKINSLDAGGTGPGTFFRWELKPGIYSFAAYASESSAIVEIDVKPNEHYFIRQDERIGLNGTRPTLIMVEEKDAIKAMEKSKLLISAYRN